MIPNKSVFDAMMRYKILLIGYSRYVAEQIIKFLDATEPKIRKALFDIFQESKGGPRLITRLRAAEKLLKKIRGAGWSRAADEAMRVLLQVAKYTPKVLSQNVGTKLDLPTPTAIERRAKSALVSGRTVPEWLSQMEDSDIAKMVGQLRVSVLAGEEISQTVKRITGKLSPVAAAARRGIGTLLESAIAGVATVTFQAATALNKSVWDRELWVSVLDSNTTAGCFALSGQTFPIGVGPQPGSHFRCRSSRIPFDSSAEAYAPASYSAWVSDQDSEFVDYAGKEFDSSALRPIQFDRLKNMV